MPRHIYKMSLRIHSQAKIYWWNFLQMKHIVLIYCPYHEIIDDDPAHWSDYHIEAARTWPPFRRQHFQMHCLEWKYIDFDWNFTEVFFPNGPINSFPALI